MDFRRGPKPDRREFRGFTAGPIRPTEKAKDYLECQLSITSTSKMPSFPETLEVKAPLGRFATVRTNVDWSGKTRPLTFRVLGTVVGTAPTCSETVIGFRTYSRARLRI